MRQIDRRVLCAALGLALALAACGTTQTTPSPGFPEDTNRGTGVEAATTTGGAESGAATGAQATPTADDGAGDAAATVTPAAP